MDCISLKVNLSPIYSEFFNMASNYSFTQFISFGFFGSFRAIHSPVLLTRKRNIPLLGFMHRKEFKLMKS